MRAAFLAFVALLLAACSASVAERGEPGEDGAPGPRGPRGPQGRDAAFATYVVHGDTEVSPGEWSTAVAECEPGDVVIHGGCQWGAFTLDGNTIGAVVPYLDGPIGQDGGPHTFRMWQCQGLSVVEHTTRISVVAMCLEGGDS